MDQAFAVIHEANPLRLPLTLELGRDRAMLSLTVGFAPALRAIVEGQLYAQYPDARLEQIAEEPLPSGHVVWTAELSLAPDLFPIRRYGQFEDPLNRLTADPLAGLLSTLTQHRPGSLLCRVELVVRPCQPSRRRNALRALGTLCRPFFRRHHRLAGLYLSLALSPFPLPRIGGWFLSRLAPQSDSHGPSLTATVSRTHEREEDLVAAAEKLRQPLFETRIRLIVIARPTADAAARQKIQEMAGAFGTFSSPRLSVFRISRIRHSATMPRRFSHPAFLLSSEELATIFHPKTLSVRAPTLATVESRELAPPVTLPLVSKVQGLAMLGVTAFRSHRERFGILPEDRMRHVAILGKTGMGKSTLLWNLLTSDISAGRGVALIDPHGDLAESLLPAIPRQRTNEVVLFDAGDTSHPLAFNPLSCPDPSQRPLVASGVLSAFKKLYGDSWGPRLEHILRNSLLALLEIPGTSLISVLRLLGDVRYRQSVTSKLSDPIVRAFWQQEFAGMTARLRAEAIAPVQNKVGAFVSSPLLRNILGQPENRLDLRSVMDSGKVLIVNLSKGRIGDDAATLLGSLLVTSLQIAAMGRAEIPEWLRRDFFLYIDEFQSFSTDSFTTIFSEARKYRLALTIANQYLAQMDEQTEAAVFGNVGTLLLFQVGAKDAEVLSEQLGGELTPQDLMTLPRYQAYARLLIDGQPSCPFSMRTLPPSRQRPDERRSDIIRRSSRQRYGRRSADVDAEIRHSLAVR